MSLLQDNDFSPLSIFLNLGLGFRVSSCDLSKYITLGLEKTLLLLIRVACILNPLDR